MHELWFLHIALLLTEIYLPMKFQVYTSFSFRDMANVKVSGQTRTHTDRQTDPDGTKTICPTIFDPGHNKYHYGWTTLFRISYFPNFMLFNFDLICANVLEDKSGHVFCAITISVLCTLALVLVKQLLNAFLKYSSACFVHRRFVLRFPEII